MSQTMPAASTSCGIQAKRHRDTQPDQCACERGANELAHQLLCAPHLTIGNLQICWSDNRRQNCLSSVVSHYLGRAEKKARPASTYTALATGSLKASIMIAVTMPARIMSARAINLRRSVRSDHA